MRRSKGERNPFHAYPRSEGFQTPRYGKYQTSTAT